jgi:glycosyltransferase involved in cell wall biosynthesis
MRALHVIPSIGPLRGGPSVAMGIIARALRDAGVHVDVATTNDNDTELLNVPIAQPVDENGVRYWYFERTMQPYTTSAGLASWLRVNTANYDVVHAHALFSFSTSASAAAARRSAVPYVVRPLGTLARYGMQQHSLLKQLSWYTVERRLLKQAAAVHFTSEAEREESERLGKWRSVVIPLGIDAPSEVTHVPTDSERPVYLFLSRIHPKKRVELLLQAFWLVRETVPAAQLIVAGFGDGEYVRSLKSLGEELGVSSNVTWVGHTTGSDKTALLAQATAFVLPSVNENFGIAPVEALAAGVPVILTRGVAIHREVEAHEAGIIADDTVSDLADAMLQLRDPATRGAMSQRAAALARSTFSVDAMKRGLVALYEKILAA